jgi:hypothetical protein
METHTCKETPSWRSYLGCLVLLGRRRFVSETGQHAGLLVHSLLLGLELSVGLLKLRPDADPAITCDWSPTQSLPKESLVGRGLTSLASSSCAFSCNGKKSVKSLWPHDYVSLTSFAEWADLSSWICSTSWEMAARSQGCFFNKLCQTTPIGSVPRKHGT